MNENTGLSSARPVVVAVNGSDGSTAAVRYAAREAARIGCDLKIVHVAPTYLPIAGMAPGGGAVAVDAFVAVGRDILKSSAKPAYSILPRERVTTVLELGSRTALVLELAREGRMLVVGDDRTPVLARIAAGRFIGTIAARSLVPVVSVPATWTADRGEREERKEHRVLLAVKDPQLIPFELLRAGFQAAQDHGADLEIAHVWDLPTGYDGVVEALRNDRAAQTLIERAVRRLAGPLRQEFPDVSYTAHSWYGRPAEILREHARGADLLLLARRERGFPLGHFGATGKALLRETPCPVEVFPTAERAPRPAPTEHHSTTPQHHPAGAHG